MSCCLGLALLPACSDAEEPGSGVFTSAATGPATGMPTGPDDGSTDDGSGTADPDDSGAETSDGSPSGTSGEPPGDTDGGTDTDGGDEIEHMPPGLCDEAVPPGSPEPPAPPAYSGGVCPQITAGYNVGFSSQGRQREFAFVAPSDYDPTKSYPLVFGWYHLTGNAMDFVETIDAQALADYTQALIVVPQDTGDFEFVWPDTPLDEGQAGVDLGLFDDLYACISEQFNVNRHCVSSLGVSAGGLWTAYLGQRRGQYLASNLAFSGGYPDDIGWWGWQSSGHKFASLVLWGGPSDQLILNFDEAAKNYIAHLQGDAHFVLRCEHTGGHGLPPMDPGDTGPFEAVFHFIRNHPYWASDSLLVDEGMPEFYPDYCTLP